MPKPSKRALEYFANDDINLAFMNGSTQASQALRAWQPLIESRLLVWEGSANLG